MHSSTKDLTIKSGTDLAADWLTTASQFGGEFDAQIPGADLRGSCSDGGEGLLQAELERQGPLFGGKMCFEGR